MEDFQFGEAQRQIYDFLWSEFCDWYIEIAKIRLRDENAVSPIPVLVHVLETSLRLLASLYALYYRGALADFESRRSAARR